jgi:hypothetical protein
VYRIIRFVSFDSDLRVNSGAIINSKVKSKERLSGIALQDVSHDLTAVYILASAWLGLCAP